MPIPVPQRAANSVRLVFLHKMEPRTDVHGGQRLDVFGAPRHQVGTKDGARLGVEQQLGHGRTCQPVGVVLNEFDDIGLPLDVITRWKRYGVTSTGSVSKICSPRKKHEKIALFPII